MGCSSSTKKTDAIMLPPEVQEETVVDGHSENVNIISFSYDGVILGSGSEDGSVKLWNANDGTLLFTLKDVQKEVLSLAFSHDGAHLFSGDSNKTIT